MHNLLSCCNDFVNCFNDFTLPHPQFLSWWHEYAVVFSVRYRNSPGNIDFASLSSSLSTVWHLVFSIVHPSRIFSLTKRREPTLSRLITLRLKKHYYFFHSSRTSKVTVLFHFLWTRAFNGVCTIDIMPARLGKFLFLDSFALLRTI